MAMCFKLDLPAPLILKAAGIASELIQHACAVDSNTLVVLKLYSNWFRLVKFSKILHTSDTPIEFKLSTFEFSVLVWFRFQFPVFYKNQIPVVPVFGSFYRLQT